MKIFAYGSNMCHNRLKARVPSAKKIANAYLEGYQMICNKKSVDGSGKGNVIKTDNPNDKVWGVIFEIDPQQKPDLDRAEGLGYGYHEDFLQVKSENTSHIAQLYLASEEYCVENLSSYHWYKNFILTGAKENQLPQEYITQLESIPSMEDPDAERRLMNEKILSAYENK